MNTYEIKVMYLDDDGFQTGDDEIFKVEANSVEDAREYIEREIQSDYGDVDYEDELINVC